MRHNHRLQQLFASVIAMSFLFVFAGPVSAQKCHKGNQASGQTKFGGNTTISSAKQNLHSTQLQLKDGTQDHHRQRLRSGMYQSGNSVDGMEEVSSSLNGNVNNVFDSLDWGVSLEGGSNFTGGAGGGQSGGVGYDSEEGLTTTHTATGSVGLEASAGGSLTFVGGDTLAGESFQAGGDLGVVGLDLGVTSGGGICVTISCGVGAGAGMKVDSTRTESFPTGDTVPEPPSSYRGEGKDGYEPGTGGKPPETPSESTTMGSHEDKVGKNKDGETVTDKQSETEKEAAKSEDEPYEKDMGKNGEGETVTDKESKEEQETTAEAASDGFVEGLKDGAKNIGNALNPFN